jgi:hypothetical protein
MPRGNALGDAACARRIPYHGLEFDIALRRHVVKFPGNRFVKPGGIRA